jgi:hypothetical protein
MDSKDKRKQYYINYRDRILEKSKQYYHDNKVERKFQDNLCIQSVKMNSCFI